MQSDIEIAQLSELLAISTVAQTIGLTPEEIIPHGHHIAKISPQAIARLKNNSSGKLILVTAINPTPAGEGKTTTTVGLADALNLVLQPINQQAMVCIREPSLGPVFGMKGGATGGGFAQVLPMEDINLHFTGDFHAITSANNLLAALIDNHIYQGNALKFDSKKIVWRRCLDMNDRALRHISLHGKDKNSATFQQETGFDITVASEVMAIFCLAENFEDLKQRLGEILVGVNQSGEPIFAKHLQAEGAMAALLKNAFLPNLVQTIEHTPAIVHGGPFANIAHGCNSVIATKTALKLSDYVVTEAGFGADLGAEKFIDIKCRQSGLMPDAVVLVATIRALKYHGGVDVKDLSVENIAALEKGMANIEKHLENLTAHFGLKVVVAINHFTSDTQVEITTLQNALAKHAVQVVLCKHWAQGGMGAISLAEAVLNLIEPQSEIDKNTASFLYQIDLPIRTKIETIAQKIYGASHVEFSALALEKLAFYEEKFQYTIANFPVCIAKNQYSFSSDASLKGAPTGHVLTVRDLKISHGAGFVVVICGDIMTMPGLPKNPASERINVNQEGQIVGLS
jgi:formate--tetrahydrofolate ligase